jgi:L,D-transpeptidase ErfK/SrfK
MLKIQTRVLLLSACMAPPAFGLTFTLPANDAEGVGNSVHISKYGESLSSIGQRYRIAAAEIRKANPGLRNRGIQTGTRVKIPARYRLPSGPREGIVLNLAERRLYYFHPDGVTVSTYPVGVGKQGWSTPTGTTTIVRKVKNPTWTPPPSIVREARRRGKTLRVVGPGPRNPLGRRALYLGMPRILMHGTTAPGSVGRASSHGCIRMLNKDVEDLYDKVPVGTTVRIVNERKK